jgi:hypothetical protein
MVLYKIKAISDFMDNVKDLDWKKFLNGIVSDSSNAMIKEKTRQLIFDDVFFTPFF